MNNLLKFEILKHLNGSDLINGALGLGNSKLVIESLKNHKYGYYGNEKIGLIMNVLKSNYNDFEQWLNNNKKHLDLDKFLFNRYLTICQHLPSFHILNRIKTIEQLFKRMCNYASLRIYDIELNDLEYMIYKYFLGSNCEY